MKRAKAQLRTTGTPPLGQPAGVPFRVRYSKETPTPNRPYMDIIEFFEQSAGKWFSQRTSHYMAPPQLETGTTDLWTDILAPSDPEVIKLCRQYRIEPSLALSGARVKWNGTVGAKQLKQVGSTVLVPIPSPDSPNTGKLLQQTLTLNAPVAGRYIMGSDDCLTLIIETPDLYSEERLWFESPNFRLRTSTVKRPSGVSVASFCSEIRMGGAQPPAKTAASAQQA
ncbi:phycobiliprotein lyase [Kamptonema formosum]|uniref:phycobiliprotein lyase n=1 Tax=Kamptonema formosum TaxID=331992 RepID=UPI00351093B7